MLLGVFNEQGKLEKTLRDTILDRLTRLGEDITAAPEANDLATCKQVVCYAEISTRTNASRLLRVDVYESAARRYYFEGALYEHGKGSSRTANGSCDDCSSENLRAVLGDLTARLVTTNEKPVPRPANKADGSLPLPEHPPQLIPTVQPSGAIPSPGPRRSHWTPGRIALVTLLSAVTGVTLLGTILVGTAKPEPEGEAAKWLCTLDEKTAPTKQPPCISQTALTVSGSLLTGLSAASLALTLQQTLSKEASY